MAAAGAGNLEIVQLLLERKLVFSISIIQLFLSSFTEYSTLFNSEFMPLFIVNRIVYTTYMLVYSYIIICRADVNLRDNFYWTAMHHACLSGNITIVELLLKCGAKLEAKGGGFFNHAILIIDS